MYSIAATIQNNQTKCREKLITINRKSLYKVDFGVVVRAFAIPCMHNTALVLRSIFITFGVFYGLVLLHVTIYPYNGQGLFYTVRAANNLFVNVYVNMLAHDLRFCFVRCHLFRFSMFYWNSINFVCFMHAIYSFSSTPKFRWLRRGFCFVLFFGLFSFDFDKQKNIYKTFFCVQPRKCAS